MESVGLDDMKLHLRVDIDDDDALITSLIKAATRSVENITRRALITQTWEMALDNWPGSGEIVIPLPPLQSISSIKYKDSEGVESTWDAANYIVEVRSDPGRVKLAYEASYPTDTLYPIGAIKVTFVAGYGDAATDITEAITAAVKLLVGTLYENRENIVIGQLPKEVPFTVESLLSPYRVFSFSYQG